MKSAISRRALFRGLSVAAGAIVGTAATATASHTGEQTKTLDGRIAWSNRLRAMIMFHPDDQAAPCCLFELKPLPQPADFDVAAFRPGRRVTLTIGVDMFSPLQVRGIMLENGTSLSVNARVLSLTWPSRDKIEDILQVVSAQFRVSASDIVSEHRARPIVRARQTAIYLSHRLTGHSLFEIGHRFGNRDHTVVLHAIRKIQGELAENEDHREEIERLVREIDRLEAYASA